MDEKTSKRKNTRRRFILGAATAAAAGLAAQAIAIKPAFAQAYEPFLGEIAMVTFNFAPQGWALCNGQLLNIAQNTALFALLGTTYGGDGVKTFALPNLQGRIPMHQGNSHVLGQSGGVETVTLTQAQMPKHGHVLTASQNSATTKTPKANVLATETQNTYASATNLANMSSSAIGTAGGNAPHTNLQPYLTINFIIALQGVFPSQD